MENQTQFSHNYLNRYHHVDHALANMINEPRPDNGLVYTPAEIAQQPYLWKETAALIADQAIKLKSFLKKYYFNSDGNRPQIILTGAGSSDFVGLSLLDLYRSYFKTTVVNWSSTRITANPGDYFNNHQLFLVIHFARSGNSPESKAVLKMLLEKYPDNTSHIVITCNKNGELAKISADYSDRVYLITLPDDSNDKGLAMTSSFSSMVVAGQAITHLDDIKNYQQIVDRLVSSAEYFIDTHTDDIRRLADPGIDRVFYLGNKDLLGAANESALKVQELTAGYVLAKSDDTLGFRHGPVSGVGNDSLVCFFLSEDPYTRRYEIDVIKQYESKFHSMGAVTVAIGSNTEPLLKDSSVQFLPYDPDKKWNIPAYYQVNLAVLFGQLFGLFQACRRNINVDNPSVEKATYNRIVQGVQLYDY